MCTNHISLYPVPLKLVSLIIAVCVSGHIGCSKNPTSVEVDDNELKYVSPEEVGWSSEKLEEAKQCAEESGYAAVMALYDGKVFFSWGDITRNYKCHSIRKPFLSALYGIHVAQGNINLDATLKDLHIDDIPPGLTPEEKQATVRDLIKSRSGVYHEAAAEVSGIEWIENRPARGSHPGFEIGPGIAL